MPYKASFVIVLFLIFFAAMPGVLASSGTADYIGYHPEVCAQELTESEEMQKFDTGQTGGSTLFGLYNSLAKPLESLFNSIFPGAAMLKCGGVPPYMVNFLFAGLAIVPGRDLIKFLRSG